MPDLSSETIVLKQNAIRLVRRADAETWQAHYKVDALGRWIRRSTGTADLEVAKVKADDFWSEARYLANRGHPVLSKKFKAVAEVVLRDLEQKVAANKSKRGSNNDYISALNLYLIPFFGGYNIDCITQAVFSNFCEWRREKAGKELSHSTQLNHNAAMNAVLNYGVEKGYLTNLQKPILKNTGETGERRPVFNEKELEQIATHLPAWVAKAREGVSRMLRELLSVYIQFAAATGVRTGTEMLGLEWRHIEIYEGESEPVLLAHIRKGKTVKKGEPALAVLHRSCWLYLEKMRQLTPEFQHKTLDEVLREKHELKIFRMSNGEQPNQLTKQFKQLLIELNLLRCPITGEVRTLYSLRHFAITRLVVNGVTAEQMEQQVRTSAPMLTKHYNHMNPLMNAAKFAGLSGAVAGDEISRIINSAPNDDLLHFAELGTGLTLSLVMQNKPALNTLREELAKKKIQAS